MGTLVVIPCGRGKLNYPAAAGVMYIGMQHRLTRQAADAIADDTGGQVMILSALHGLLTLNTLIEPYDLQLGEAGAVTVETVAAQLSGRSPDRVVALTPKRYSAVLVEAASSLSIPVTDVLAGSRGLLEQRAILARIKRGEEAA